MTIPTVAQVESGAAPVYVDINNVAKYYYEQVGEGGEISEIAPIIMPPFHTSVFSYFPKILQSFFSGKVWIVVNVGDPSLVDHIQFYEIDQDSVYAAVKFSIYAGASAPELYVSEETMLVDRRGERLSRKTHFDCADWLRSREGFDPLATSYLMQEIVYVVKLAISFMHCKNIDLLDKPTTRQYRRMMKRKKQPIIQYKTLNIEAFKEQVRYESKQSGENEIKRALHICRGHFATYTEDSPLFGKYVGTYWKPMHARGSSALGEVRKNYSIDID